MFNYDWNALKLASDEDLPWDNYDTIVEEAKQAEKTYLSARSVINDALLRYKKKKLNAQNKKQAEDMKLLFGDLEDYGKEEDIREAYGWDIISEKEMRRLIELWQTREKYVDENGNYSDAVTQLINGALEAIYQPYADMIGLANRMQDIVEAQKREKMLRSIVTSIFR